MLNKLVPLVKGLPFFMDRGLKDNSVSDTLALMTYKEAKKDDFIIEFGSYGDEFYVVLEGTVEVLVPDKASSDVYKKVCFEHGLLKSQLDGAAQEIETFQNYLDQLEIKKAKED